MLLLPSANATKGGSANFSSCPWRSWFWWDNFASVNRSHVRQNSSSVVALNSCLAQARHVSERRDTKHPNSMPLPPMALQSMLWKVIVLGAPCYFALGNLRHTIIFQRVCGSAKFRARAPCTHELFCGDENEEGTR